MKPHTILSLLRALVLTLGFPAYAQDVPRGTEQEVTRMVNDALARIREVGIEKCLRRIQRSEQ